ncbi:hypothetical protein EDB85DRAFT_2157000 [Lactarius pseudohatsudake]|nr:hypothetical protein EDB85DRAFT_2157000 [Lactarius pseudohatsudake]
MSICRPASCRTIPFRFKKGDNSRQSNAADEADLDGIRNVLPEEGSQGDGKDSADEDAGVDGDRAAEDPGLRRRPRPRHHRLSSSKAPTKVQEESTAALATRGDCTNPPPHQPPHSLTNRSQPSPATKAPAAPPLSSQSQSLPQGKSPKSVLKKPWVDKFNFLASLSKDGKYQDLLRELNQMFLSNQLLVSNQAPSIPLGLAGHGLRCGFRRRSTLAVTSRFGSEGASGNFSIDGIALGIGSLLRDLEAMQFSDEFHPPEHVAHSNVGFGVVRSIIHPALDNFLKIIKDHNSSIATDDSQGLPEPVAPPSTSTEQQGKRHRKVRGSDDSDADARTPNRQKNGQWQHSKSGLSQYF